MSHLSKSQKLLLAILKIALAAAVLGYLFIRIQRADRFEQLISGPKQWPDLILAQGLILCAFSLSFLRWFLLVRGLELDFHLRDAFRLGTLGFMLNQILPGSIGGDLLKAVFIAREQPGKRTEAVATVLVDRAVGFYAMILVACMGLALANHTLPPIRLMISLQTIVWSAAIFGTVGAMFVLSPLATGRWVKSQTNSLPIVGHTITRLIDAAEVYRSQRIYLYAAFALAIITHSLFVTTFWCISSGLPVYGPTFSQNASIVPMALVAGVMPFTPGGLGVLEAALEFFYTTIGAAAGDGTIVALTYRAMSYVVTGVGACYYFSSRKNVERMLHEAESLADELE